MGLLAAHFPPALRTPGATLDDATYEKLRSGWARAIQSSPVLLVVAYDPESRAPDSEGDFLGHVGLGCVLENMWLTANALGLSVHVVSILAKEPADAEVKSLLGLPGQMKIAFAIRLGYAPPPEGRYRRVRREVEEFTHYNRFGSTSSR